MWITPLAHPFPDGLTPDGTLRAREVRGYGVSGQPGSGPVATGRVGSFDQAENEPG